MLGLETVYRVLRDGYAEDLVINELRLDSLQRRICIGLCTGSCWWILTRIGEELLVWLQSITAFTMLICFNNEQYCACDSILSNISAEVGKFFEKLFKLNLSKYMFVFIELFDILSFNISKLGIFMSLDRGMLQNSDLWQGIKILAWFSKRAYFPH